MDVCRHRRLLDEQWLQPSKCKPAFIFVASVQSNMGSLASSLSERGWGESLKGRDQKGK